MVRAGEALVHKVLMQKAEDSLKKQNAYCTLLDWKFLGIFLHGLQPSSAWIDLTSVIGSSSIIIAAGQKKTIKLPEKSV